MLPYAASAPPPAVPPHDPADLPDGLAVVVGTSGSTGTPKRALLTAAALAASSRATHEQLGGPGQWLLALPAHHVAGLQVLLRSLDAGTTPVAMDLTDGFLPPAFVAATAPLDPGQRATPAWCPPSCCGCSTTPGGPTPCGPSTRCSSAAPRCPRGCAPGRAGAGAGGRDLRHERDRRWVRLRREAVALHRDRLRRRGRIHLGGATVAHGYLGRPDLTAEAFGVDEDGMRWFRTDDVGHTDEYARLHVDGRVDDLVNTGGLKVAPRLVEEAILDHVPGVAEVVVVGSPDPEWGEAVCALVVLEPGAVRAGLTAAELRAHLRGILPDHALPRRAGDGRRPAPARAGQARPACGGRPVHRGRMTACSATSRPCSSSR